jgi:dephospho-CoA kinase
MLDLSLTKLLRLFYGLKINKIAITGNVASGKTFALSKIPPYLNVIINSDDEIVKIYELSEVKKFLIKEFGIFEKSELSKVIFGSAGFGGKLLKLENFLFRFLFSSWISKVQKAQRIGIKTCFIEVPLLFEKNLERYFNKNILVFAPIYIRKQRFIMRHRHLNKQEALKKFTHINDLYQKSFEKNRHKANQIIYQNFRNVKSS